MIKFSANLGSIKKTIDISHALESIGLLAAQTIPTKIKSRLQEVQKLNLERFRI